MEYLPRPSFLNRIRNLLIIILAKLCFFLIRFLSFGAGSTWPGHIALFLNKNFIKEILADSKLKIILIIGTNGKTTTASLLRFVLEKKEGKVFQNEEGANLLNGVASSIIKNINLSGDFSYQWAIWEIDENTFPLLTPQVKPEAVVVLNLFRDQLDRYGEVNLIASKWFSALKKLPSYVSIFLNGDDPQLYYIGKQLKQPVYFFGLNKKLMKITNIPHDVDFNFCPICNGKLHYERIAYSHLGDFSCRQCSFKRMTVETFSRKKIFYPLAGIYNLYNVNAVILVSKVVFGVHLDDLNEIFSHFKPAFGRQEVIRYKNRLIYLILAKNPAGFNQSISAIKDLVKNKKNNLLILLNDRIPDGKDVSWIWDVEFKTIFSLGKKIFVGGDRVYDMALRLRYEQDKKKEIKISKGKCLYFDNVYVFDKTKDSLREAIFATKENERLFILATYTAMLEVRKTLLGRKFI